MIARPVRRPGPIPFTPFQTFPAFPAAAPSSTLAATSSTTSGAPSARHEAIAPHQGGARPRSAASAPRATFHGHGVLCVRSSASGLLYRFQGHGACMEIDPRDALLLGRLTDVHVG
ncbi:MAG: hypothetical protein IIA02_03125 [Proteobacteria bacterium]|uniref:hypothetical protein n=1 Tax=Aquabacterium sp. TaxID=1872578 RepID=UPI0035C6891D|nr:hypothetical protein [Pseudomonadota bacterium]